MKLKAILESADKNVSYDNICRISVLSNITLDTYLIPFLKLSFSESNISADVRIIRFENFMSETEKIRESDLAVVLLNFECQYPDWYNDIISGKLSAEQFVTHVVGECREVYRVLKASVSCPIVWFGYENCNFRRTSVCGAVSEPASIIDKINADICGFMSDDDLHVDTEYLIAGVGISGAYDSKSKYRWNAPYSQQMIRAVSEEIYKQYLIHKGITKKCLILDCDGVLWGGILSEDGIGGIKLGNEGLGRSYQDFQRFLLTLYYHGVILALCSKNDFQDVLEVFRDHSGMILKEEHIACFKVNWNNKSDNIIEIARTLNIGLDSMVFADDSAFEVEAVRAVLPEVLSVRYDRDGIYDALSCFNLKSRVNIGQVDSRNQTYRTNEQREKLLSQSSDYDSYLKALEIKVDVHETVPGELARISELTRRTNQCTNGKRYNMTEISARFNDPLYHMYSVYVSDKFSDLGLVGVIGICEDTLDLFALSCRALGRNIEEKMIEQVINSGAEYFEFTSTAKNEKFLSFLREYLKLKT